MPPWILLLLAIPSVDADVRAGVRDVCEQLGMLARWQASMEGAAESLAEVHERLHAAGHPLTPEEIPVAPVARDAGPWLDGIAESDDFVSWEEADLVYGGDHESELARLGAAGATTAQLEAFRAFRRRLDRIDSGGDGYGSIELLERLDGMPVGYRPRELLELSEGEIAFVELELQRMGDVVTTAGRILEFDGVDDRRYLEPVLAGVEIAPQGPAIRTLLTLSRVYRARAALAGRSGDSDSVSAEIQRLERLTDLSRCLPGAPLMAGCRQLILSDTAQTIGVLAPFLPDDVDVHIRWCEAQQPRAELAEFVRSYRAYGLRSFRVQVQPGGHLEDLARLVGTLGLGFEPDELFFLETIERFATYCALDWPEARASSLNEPPFPGGRPDLSVFLSSYLLPDVEPYLRGAIRNETQLVFARAALIARRDGPAVAKEWLEGPRDPFSGEPFRVDPDRFRVWSVGANLEDDGGVPFADADREARYEDRWDIVWEWPEDER